MKPLIVFEGFITSKPVWFLAFPLNNCSLSVDAGILTPASAVCVAGKPPARGPLLAGSFGHFDLGVGTFSPISPLWLHRNPRRSRALCSRIFCRGAASARHRDGDWNSWG